MYLYVCSKPPTEQGPFWQLCSHTPTPGGIHHPKPAGRTVCITRQQPFLLFPASKQASSRDLPDPSSGVRALRHSPLLTWGHGWEGHQGPVCQGLGSTRRLHGRVVRRASILNPLVVILQKWGEGLGCTLALLLGEKKKKKTHTKRKNPTATLWWESGLGIRSGPGFPALALAWMSMSLFLVTVPIPVPVFGQVRNGAFIFFCVCFLLHLHLHRPCRRCRYCD